jgi:hypothetical protein
MLVYKMLKFMLRKLWEYFIYFLGSKCLECFCKQCVKSLACVYSTLIILFLHNIQGSVFAFWGLWAIIKLIFYTIIWKLWLEKVLLGFYYTGSSVSRLIKSYCLNFTAGLYHTWLSLDKFFVSILRMGLCYVYKKIMLKIAVFVFRVIVFIMSKNVDGLKHTLLSTFELVKGFFVFYWNYNLKVTKIIQSFPSFIDTVDRYSYNLYDSLQWWFTFWT